MNRQTIHPKNEADWLALRRKDITSTEISALFGISPYATEFEVWHRHRNDVTVEFMKNERMEWGNYLQDSIAAKFAKDNDWTIRKMTEYMRIPELRLGSSFDFSIESYPQGLLEIKNLDSLVAKKDWILDDDSMEASPHIELQCQHQLLISGRPYLYIGCCIGGNRGVLIARQPDPAIHAAIIEKSKAFWKSIDANEEPKPDFQRDAEFVSKLYGYAEPGKVLDAKDSPAIDALMRSYHEAQQKEKQAGIEKDAAKAEILTLIGDAEKVLGNGWSISAGLIGEAEIKFTRKAYRGFKAYFKKENLI